MPDFVPSGALVTGPRNNEIQTRERMMDAIKESEQGSDTDVIRLALKEAKELVRSLEGTATTRMLVKAGGLQIEIQREAGAVVAIPEAPTPGTARLAAGGRVLSSGLTRGQTSCASWGHG